MKIERIKWQDALFHIDFDGGFSLSISESCFVRYNLYKGKELKEAEVLAIEENNKNQKALNFVLNKSMNRKTRHEIASILENEGFDKKSINYTLEYLIEYKYIDDMEYASLFVKDKMRLNRYGPIKIKYMLQMKGIDESYISLALNKYSHSIIQANIHYLLKKKFKDYDFHDLKSKSRMYNYLQQKGYSYQDINQFFKGKTE